MTALHAIPLRDHVSAPGAHTGVGVRLLDLLSGPAGRFVVPRHGTTIDWEHHATHATCSEADPELYALGALADTTDAHRIQVLFQLLRAGRSGLTEAARHTADRVVTVLLAALSDDDVLTAFLALRRVRVHRAHATRAFATWLFGHPALAALVARRRPAVRDVLDHVLGVAVSRASLRAIASGAPALRLDRLGVATEDLGPVAAWLLRDGSAPAAPVAERARLVLGSAPAAPRPRTVTVTNRGALSAALVHLWRGTPSDALRSEVDDAVAARAATLPRFDGRLALVLDTSASMAGYGDRALASVSQATALWLCLSRCVADLRLVSAGASISHPSAAYGLRAAGATDLASGVIDALRTAPDLVAVVTDGYETVRSGDLARLVQALPGAGVDTPIVLCTVLFTAADDLTHRRPAPGLPELSCWHEDDFDALITRLCARAPGPVGRRFLCDALRRRLPEV